MNNNYHVISYNSSNTKIIISTSSKINLGLRLPSYHICYSSNSFILNNSDAVGKIVSEREQVSLAYCGKDDQNVTEEGY